MDTEQLQADLKFLLSFAPAQTPDEVPSDLGAMFYVTNSYEGDVAIAQHIQDIRERYGITRDDLDDLEIDEEEL
jgi:hypothetical protein